MRLNFKPHHKEHFQYAGRAYYQDGRIFMDIDQKFDEKRGVVYIITTANNDRVIYVGQSRQSITDRQSSHFRFMGHKAKSSSTEKKRQQWIVILKTYGEYRIWVAYPRVYIPELGQEGSIHCAWEDLLIGIYKPALNSLAKR